MGANRTYIPIARSYGWYIGARLPCTLYPDHFPLYFADQDWRKFEGLHFSDDKYQKHYRKYIDAVKEHRPYMASVVDWTPDKQLEEVMIWATEIAQYVELVQVIPKIPREVDKIPHHVGGKKIVLGFSVPTKHGATPCYPEEFAGRDVHLLGGNPIQQTNYAGLLTTYGANIISTDGNLINKASGFGTFWENGRSRSLGNKTITTVDAIERSLKEIPRLWKSVGWTVE